MTETADAAAAGAAPKLTMRDRHRLMTREHLMTAALEAFAERGYVAVTIDDIVRRAGVGRATFYLHFDSKAAVLRELRDTRMTVWTEEHAPRGGESGALDPCLLREGGRFLHVRPGALHSLASGARRRP